MAFDPTQSRVRLTLFYGLEPYLDEEAFFVWHSQLLAGACSTSASTPAELPAISGSTVRFGWGDRGALPRGFVTTLDWEDASTFRDAFYSSGFQHALHAIESVTQSSLALLSFQIS